MMRRLFWLAPVTVLFYSVFATNLAAGSKAGTWVEVQSPHFTVISNAGEKTGRRVAGRFEQIRAAFHMTFPTLNVNPDAPIVVLAVKSHQDFVALSPASWLRKGEVRHAGYFLKTPDVNCVLLSLDDKDENPYHVLFHEYTHLLLHQGSPMIPVWLDEGIAEYYGNSEVRSKEILLGKPSAEHIILLRQNHLLKLHTLFSVGHNSPYYNEQHKGTMFYAESWALTHYLMTKGFREKKDFISAYLTEIGHGKDAVTAATDVFGNPADLEKALEAYIRKMSFAVIKVKGATRVDPKSFTAQVMSPAESEAVRGDLLARNRRYADAQTMLKDALRQDPKSAAAMVSMGMIELEQKHQEEAQKWFARAVPLSSKNFVADYYYARMAMESNSLDAATSAQVQKSLKTAIKVNPRFAPAYDALAHFYAEGNENLDQAHMMALHAVALDPSNVYYRLTAAGVLLRMKRVKDGIAVAQKAEKIAKSSAEWGAVASFLGNALQYQASLAEQKKWEADQRAAAARAASSSPPPSFSVTHVDKSSPAPPVLRHRETPPGPRDRAAGVIKTVKCSGVSLDMEFDTRQRELHLHTDNYFHVQFSALNYQPKGKLYPCRQIQAVKARISFYDIKGHPNEGELISVQLKK